MHSGSPTTFHHGPRWFRHHAPTGILLISITAFVLVFAGLGLEVRNSNRDKSHASDAATPVAGSAESGNSTSSHAEKYDLPHGARHLTYGVYRALFFHDEIDHKPAANGLILSGEILAAVSAGLVGLGLIFLLGHKGLLWWYTRHDHVVICGLGERIGLPLARAYRITGTKSDRRKVIAITLAPEAPHRRHSIDALCDLGGVIVLPGDATDPAMLKMANVAGADRVFAVTTDDAKNMEIAMAVAAVTGNSSCPAHCHVHIDDPERASLLIDRMQQLPGLRETETFSLRHQIIRGLVRDLFADTAPGPRESAHVVLLGFGSMGQGIAQELGTQAHFLNHQRLRLSIADRHIDGARDAFLERFPAFCPAPGLLSFGNWDARLDRWDSLAHRPDVRPVAEARIPDLERAKGATPVEYVCNAEFLELPEVLSTGSLVPALRQRLAQCDIGAVVVCTKNMPRNAEIALALQTELNPARPLTVWVWLPKGDAFAQLMKPSPTEQKSRVRLVPFGLADELKTPLQLVQAPFEQEARAAHAAYLTQRKAAGKFDPNDESMRPWYKLPARTRNENRELIANSEFKLRALRAAGIEFESSTVQPEKAEQPTAAEIKALAELEHNRWMANKLMHGFRYAPVTDKPARRHALLVPYSSLTEEAKKQDRSIVHRFMDGRALRRRSREQEKGHLAGAGS